MVALAPAVSVSSKLQVPDAVGAFTDAIPVAIDPYQLARTSLFDTFVPGPEAAAYAEPYAVEPPEAPAVAPPDVATVTG